jgi:hypothetical protein
MMHRSAIAKMLGSSWVITTKVRPRLFESRRGHRVEPAGRLVEEDDVGIERHRAGDRGALHHAAADLGRREVARAAEVDEPQLRLRDEVHRLVRDARVLLEREADVLHQRHVAEQRAELVHHAEALQDREAPLALRLRDVLARDEDAARERPVQADQVLEQHRLPAARAAEDREHLAAPDLERDVLVDDEVAEPGPEVLDPDDGLLLRVRTHGLTLALKSAKDSRLGRPGALIRRGSRTAPRTRRPRTR